MTRSLAICQSDVDMVFVALDILERNDTIGRHGFICDRSGRVIIPVYTEKSDLRGRQARDFLRTLNLSLDEFQSLIDGRMSRDAYLMILQTRLDGAPWT